MAWYKEMNFYELTLLNGEFRIWQTELSFEEAKRMIGEENFLTVVSKKKNENIKEEINTKVIKTIKDETEENRRFYKRAEQDFRRRLSIVRKIRKKTLPFLWRIKVKILEKELQKSKLDWQDEEIGLHIDALMQYNESYLKELLKKCK